MSIFDTSPSQGLSHHLFRKAIALSNDRRRKYSCKTATLSPSLLGFSGEKREKKNAFFGSRAVREVAATRSERTRQWWSCFVWLPSEDGCSTAGLAPLLLLACLLACTTPAATACASLFTVHSSYCSCFLYSLQYCNTAKAATSSKRDQLYYTV